MSTTSEEPVQHLVVAIPSTLARRVRVITDANDGPYQDTSEFVRVAIENQLSLDWQTVDKKRPATVMARRQTQEGKPAIQPTESASVVLAPEDRARVTRYWRIEAGSALPTPAPTPVPARGDALSSLTNRMGPLLAGVRVLVVGSAASGSMQVEDFVGRSSDVARFLAGELRKLDREAGRKGIAKWSIGWPAGKDVQKSLARFRRYFLVETRGTENVGPFLDLGLCTISGDTVRPTARCQAIAGEPSGVFGESGDLLSDRQCGEFIEALLAIEGERIEVAQALSAMASGGLAVGEFEDSIQASHGGWSAAQVTAQRAAMLGRLFQLGLVETSTVRDDQDGFITTDLGNEVLEKVADVWR